MGRGIELACFVALVAALCLRMVDRNIVALCPLDREVVFQVVTMTKTSSATRSS